MKNHLALFITSFRRIFASPMAGLLNILVIGIALSLPAGMYILLKNANSLGAQLSSAPQINVFMRLDASEQDIDKVHELLKQHPAVVQVEFIDRKQALAQLKQSTGLNDVLGGLSQNPLPDTFVIHPKPSQAQELDALNQELGKLPNVELTQLDTVWAYRLEALLEFGRIFVLILASLLSVALVAITFNTIRLQILTQREEIEVSKLIGATNSFIRRPFLYFGASQGLLGGITAWLIISISLAILNQQLGVVSGLYASQFVLQPLSAADCLSLLLFAVYLGWLGAWLSVVRHLSRSEIR